LLLVDKPAGVTSHDVVSAARRAIGERRIGHAGTLDPFATGLLVLLVGRATRLLPYLDGEPKVYEATIRFGTETTTDDLTGDVTTVAPAPTDDSILAAIPHLTGALDQVPPAFSAKQVGGTRAHAAARRGAPLDLGPVRVLVHQWTVGSMRNGEIDVTITCGGGTYIRALARDLGRLTGSAAHLTALRRVRSGAFSVDDAVPLDVLQAGGAALRPPIEALRGMPVESLDDAQLALLVRGMPVTATIAGERAALVDGAGALAGVAARAGERWQPRVVLRDG
jgi:tRNA pseudouridine55 synthase